MSWRIDVAVHTPAHAALGDLLSYASATVLAPGTLFGYDPVHRDSMRFNVALSDEPRVQHAFQALLRQGGR